MRLGDGAQGAAEGYFRQGGGGAVPGALGRALRPGTGSLEKAPGETARSPHSGRFMVFLPGIYQGSHPPPLSCKQTSSPKFPAGSGPSPGSEGGDSPCLPPSCRWVLEVLGAP